MVLTDDGALHRFVNVYVNDEDVRYLGSLETPVDPGDTISILPAVAGASSPHRDRKRFSARPDRLRDRSGRPSYVGHQTPVMSASRDVR